MILNLSPESLTILAGTSRLMAAVSGRTTNAQGVLMNLNRWNPSLVARAGMAMATGTGATSRGRRVDHGQEKGERHYRTLAELKAAETKWPERGGAMKCGDCAYLRAYRDSARWYCELDTDRGNSMTLEQLWERQCVRNDTRVAALKRQLADGKDCSTCRWQSKIPGSCNSPHECSMDELYDYWESREESDE